VNQPRREDLWLISEGKRGGWWLVSVWGWLVRFASKVCFQLTFSVDPTFWVGETRVFENEKAFSRDRNALTSPYIPLSLHYYAANVRTFFISVTSLQELIHKVQFINLE
jgi:hypothetical protein